MAKQSGKARRAAAERERRRARTQKDAAGRVHLAVHRDPASGQEQVVLQKPAFKDAWQNEIVAGAANTAHALFRDGPSLDGAISLGRSATAAMSRLSEALLASAPPGSVACHAGCDHCCYQVVGVTPPEALAIADHLKQTLPAEEFERVRARIDERFERGRGLSSAERFSPDHPCVFLEGGGCSVYEVRPLSCRGMNSLDAGECAARLRDPAVRAEFLAVGRGGHSYLEPIGGAQAISAGLQLGLAELHQLDMRPLELAHAMHLLLHDEQMAAAWLRGERPFEPAVAETDHASLREVAGALTPKSGT